MKPIWNAAKAIIIKHGRLLFTKNKDDSGVIYSLLGGGQESGESIHEALIRECMEEISAAIEIGDILFVRDYIGRNLEFYETDSDSHQKEYMLNAQLQTRVV